MKSIPETFCIKIKDGIDPNKVGYLQLEANNDVIQTDLPSTQILRFETVKNARKYLKKKNLHKNEHQVIPFSNIYDINQKYNKKFNTTQSCIEVIQDGKKIGSIHFDPKSISYSAINSTSGQCLFYDKQKAKDFAKKMKPHLLDDLTINVVPVDPNNTEKSNLIQRVIKRFKWK